MSADHAALAGVLAAIESRPAERRGRAVMLIAAQPGEGVSPLARSLALASGDATALLVDLDLSRNGQFAHFSDAALSGGEPLGARIDGRLGGHAFYRTVGPDGRRTADRPGLFSFQRVGRSRLFVGDFETRALLAGERAQVGGEAAFWTAAREACDLCVVDAPAFARSRAGLVVAPLMDAVVIVASAQAGDRAGTAALRDALTAAGAPLVGVVFTHADPVIASIERLAS